VPGDPPEPGPGDPRDADPTTRSSGLTPPDPGPGDPQDAKPATTPSGRPPPGPKLEPGDPRDADSATRSSGRPPPDPHPGPEDPRGRRQPQAQDRSPEAVPPEPVAPPQEPRASRLSPAPGPCTGPRLRRAGVRQRSRSAHVAAGPPESLAVQPGSAFRVRRSLREHGGEAADRRSHLPCGHPRGRARQSERVRGQRNTHCSVNSTEIAGLSWANYPRCRIAREAAADDAITGGPFLATPGVLPPSAGWAWPGKVLHDGTYYRDLRIETTRR